MAAENHITQGIRENISASWAPGDRAYCASVRGASARLVKGRVYRVADVLCGGWQGVGLALEGVAVPRPSIGFRADRFIRIAPGSIYPLTTGDAA